MSKNKTAFWVDKIVSEEHDVFMVAQVTPNTVLANSIGADFIRIQPNQTSEIHRHNQSRTVILITSGRGTAVINGKDHCVEPGNRIFIDQGVFHGFKTEQEGLEFISIQSPPILDHASGHFDKELHPNSET